MASERNHSTLFHVVTYARINVRKFECNYLNFAERNSPNPDLSFITCQMMANSLIFIHW